MIRTLRTWFRESDIFKPFNPPAHHHLSPKRPEDWATRPTRAQMWRELRRALIRAIPAAMRMGVSLRDVAFATGGLVADGRVNPGLRLRTTVDSDGEIINITRHDGS